MLLRTSPILLVSLLAIAGCEHFAKDSGWTARGSAANAPIDSMADLTECPVDNGVLPSRGGEGVLQSPVRWWDAVIDSS